MADRGITFKTTMKARARPPCRCSAMLSACGRTSAQARQ